MIRGSIPERARIFLSYRSVQTYLLSTQFSIQWEQRALSLEIERPGLQHQFTCTPISLHCLCWDTDEIYHTIGNSRLAQRQFTLAALHPTFRDSPFPEFLGFRSLDKAIGFAVVLSIGNSVLPLDGNLASPKLLVAMIATRRKPTSCQENKKINYTSTYQRGQRYKKSRSFLSMAYYLK